MKSSSRQRQEVTCGSVVASPLLATASVCSCLQKNWLFIDEEFIQVETGSCVCFICVLTSVSHGISLQSSTMLGLPKRTLFTHLGPYIIFIILVISPFPENFRLVLIFSGFVLIIEWRLSTYLLTLLTPMSDQDKISPYNIQYTINHKSDKNKKKFQFGDNQLIQY